jgi:membrane associated rhomboid family serine protease
VLEGGTPGRLLGVAYLGKLVFDAATGSGSALLPAGIDVTWAAHLGGLLIGARWPWLSASRTGTHDEAP